MQVSSYPSLHIPADIVPDPPIQPLQDQFYLFTHQRHDNLISSDYTTDPTKDIEIIQSGDNPTMDHFAKR